MTKSYLLAAAQANAQRALEARDGTELQRIIESAPQVTTVPPFGNNEPLPPPPPLVNPDQTEANRRLSEPLVTPAAPPNITTTTPPLLNGQPLPPPPPIVNPIREPDARDLLYAASMSQELARNMEAAGMGVRPPGYAAHHIVASGDGRFPEAQQARDALNALGIAINDAANGVYLPNSEELANATGEQNHRRVHSQQYYRELVNRLNRATTKEEAIEALDRIRQELQRGTFPH